MDDPLGDPLVVEVSDLLAQVMVLEQHRAACSGLQGVVGVGQTCSLGRRQVGAALPQACLVRPRGLPGGTDRLGAVLVGLRGKRPRGLRRFDQRRRLLAGLTRQLVLGGVGG